MFVVRGGAGDKEGSSAHCHPQREKSEVLLKKNRKEKPSIGFLIPKSRFAVHFCISKPENIDT